MTARCPLSLGSPTPGRRWQPSLYRNGPEQVRCRLGCGPSRAAAPQPRRVPPATGRRTKSPSPPTGPAQGRAGAASRGLAAHPLALQPGSSPQPLLPPTFRAGGAARPAGPSLSSALNAVPGACHPLLPANQSARPSRSGLCREVTAPLSFPLPVPSGSLSPPLLPRAPSERSRGRYEAPPGRNVPFNSLSGKRGRGGGWRGRCMNKKKT